MKKKLRAALLVACMLLTPIQTYGVVLHTVREIQTITKGATLIKDQLLTDAGWRDVYVLRIDLGDPNIALKPISTANLGEKETVLQMAEREKALAAINADFFSMSSNVPSFGPMIEAGEVLQAYNNKHVAVGPAKDMGTLLIDNANQIMMNYFSVGLDIYGNGAKVGEANAYNKIGTYINRPIILDTKYMKSTSGIEKQYPGIHTIVVEENQVTYHSARGEVVDIPENGYIMIMDDVNAANYYASLPIGSEVSIDINTYLGEQLLSEVENIKMGIGGGGLLMKNGQIYTGKSNVVSPNTRNPRSVVATTYNEDEILLVAIDGRGSSIGATHQEMVQLLQRYGAKDAMYLDGGGSTTLVAREQGENQVTLQNKPSDGAQRKVMNGIGVFSTSEVGDIEQLYIEPVRTRTFIGEPIKLNIRAIDGNSNPVALDGQEVQFELVGVDGRIENSVFYPESEGSALIVASIGDVQVAKEISVSKSPSGLSIEPSLVNMKPGEVKNLQIFGVDADGYKMPLTPEKITWANTNGVVQAAGNQIVAGATGTTTLEAQYGDAKAKVSVVVGDNVIRLESFEEYVPQWGGNTSSVTGYVQPSTEIKFHGERSIKMTYTFEKSGNKQVAYTVFDKPLNLPNDASSFNLWVNGRKQGDGLNVEVVDANGKKHYIKLADTIDFEGWKYLSAPLGTDIAMPAQVTKVYAYAQSIPEKRTTALYFDHASITRGERERAGITVRNDYTYDSMYKESLEAPVGDEYAINVVGATKNKNLTLDNQGIQAMRESLLKDASKVILASTQNTDLQLGEKATVYENTYQAMVQNNTQMIFLATDKGGIRQTDMSQWQKMKDTLDNTSANHVIMVMSHQPLTQFSDAREGLALHNYLVEYKEKTGKNIFVITPGGTEQEVHIESGIRYMRTPGIIGTTDELAKSSFIQFKVVGDAIYYTFKSMK